jgi:hypothetical protein
MNRYLPHVVCFLGFLLGLSLGWCLGFTRPSIKNQEQLIGEYQRVRDAFQLTDKEMAEWGGRLPEFVDSVRRQDEFAALVALGSLRQLETGDLAAAKKTLTKAISIYYRGHKYDGKTNLLARIERSARFSAEISNAIYGPLSRGTNGFDAYERTAAANAELSLPNGSR